MTGSLPLAEAARLVERYGRLERRLFQVLGGWVANVAEPGVKLLFDVHSRRHAWHSELWHQRLRELGHTGISSFSPTQVAGDERPGEPLTEGLLAALSEPVATASSRRAAGTLERMVGAYRVLVPHMIAGYPSHLRRTSHIADGPVIRSLELVLRDEIEGWKDGELLLQSLLTTEKEIRQASAHQASRETILLRAGRVDGWLPGRPS